ncbi:MAG: Asp-tRNA(Asn)/Glu-tRNA(Gln) amidotransferase subunit GatC [Candidatus Pacebacteria bacterium]|nr:Asp-tRNA(Asn)/Glu-tRNA(Gln) amidotransferase subunit GatC [Candidatus Paceibacterota bacterium]
MDFTEIDHLLKLARIELSSQEKERIALDLENILDYVRQLQKVNTNGIEPMTGGTLLENIYREDKIDKQKQNASKELKESASSLKDDYFKIPPIF